MVMNLLYPKGISSLRSRHILRLSKDAFYEIVAEAFPTIEVIDMRLFFIIVEDEVLIEAEVFEYKEKV
jgi:hypothetical protein